MSPHDIGRFQFGLPFFMVEAGEALLMNLFSEGGAAASK
jgi:hypothetical protein